MNNGLNEMKQQFKKF
uniref:Uncharacterized protein n=1 Tax=Arundo donax TaxID=35708 RepID=A0A0A9GNB8_ARUDO